MFLETERLTIRPVKPEDEIPFVEMASDGSLNDIGFDKECASWMKNWIIEAQELTSMDNPLSDYLAYTIVLKDNHTVIGSVGCSYYDDLKKNGITYFIGAKYRNNGYAKEAAKAYTAYFLNHYELPSLIATVRDENIESWKTVERAGFQLVDKKLYRDINDDEAKIYRFYEIKRDSGGA